MLHRLVFGVGIRCIVEWILGVIESDKAIVGADYWLGGNKASGVSLGDKQEVQGNKLVRPKGELLNSELL